MKYHSKLIVRPILVRDGIYGLNGLFIGFHKVRVRLQVDTPYTTVSVESIVFLSLFVLIFIDINDLDFGFAIDDVVEEFRR